LVSIQRAAAVAESNVQHAEHLGLAPAANRPPHGHRFKYGSIPELICWNGSNGAPLG
jgi:hypothetical protein